MNIEYNLNNCILSLLHVFYYIFKKFEITYMQFREQCNFILKVKVYKM